MKYFANNSTRKPNVLRRANQSQSDVPHEASGTTPSHILSRALSLAFRPSLKAASNYGKKSENVEIVIAVMGVTGAGKSSFIETVTRQKDVQVGHDLYSGKFVPEYMNTRSWSN